MKGIKRGKSAEERIREGGEKISILHRIMEEPVGCGSVHRKGGSEHVKEKANGSGSHRRRGMRREVRE